MMATTPITTPSHHDAESFDERHAIEHLDPDSYTAHRLQHATPEHLNLTTRRCFIGPIPEGWLKSHRRDWYKHHLRIHYSSRAATFSATPNTGRHRAVTGIDGPSLAAQHHHSFPQPDDVPEEEEPEPDFEDDGSTPEHEATTETPPAINIPRASEISSDPQQELIPDPEPDGAGAGAGAGPAASPIASLPVEIKNRKGRSWGLNRKASSLKSGKSTFTRKSSGADSIASFVTAQESPDEESRPRLESVDEDALAQGSPSGNSSTLRESSDRQDSFRAVIAPSNNPSSTASLVKHNTQSVAGGKGGQHTAPRSILSKLRGDRNAKLGRGEVDDRGDDIATSVNESTAEPRSPNGARTKAGLVRFNIPGTEEQQQNQQVMKMRLFQSRRRDKIRRLGKGKLQDGAIIKMEKMLVRVMSTTHELDRDFDENDSQKIDARTVQRWNELMVVCRASEEGDANFFLQMYKTRVIHAREKSRVKKRSAFEIPLTRSRTSINIFSSLDKTIVLWTPEKNGTRIFILQARSGANAMEWFTFIRGVLGWSRPAMLTVNVPDLSVSLRLNDPFLDLETSQVVVDAAQGDESAIERTMQEEQAVAGKVVHQCIEMLEKSPEWRDVVTAWTMPELHDADNALHRLKTNNRQSRMLQHGLQALDAIPDHHDLPASTYASRSIIHDPVGLAWKRYDRLEWVHGANEKKMYGTIGMEKSYELELRPKQHYATRTKTPSGETLTEPAPVEGFLIRLTSQKGAEQKLGKLFFKRLYFSSHNQFLVFSRPAHADPPPPPTLPMQTRTRVPNAQQIAEQIPLIYAVNPYPLRHGWVEWLMEEHHKSVEEIHIRDHDAYDENQRKLNNLLQCDGTINLCHVVTVRGARRGATPADANVDEGPAVDFDASVANTEQDDGTTKEFEEDRTFELVLENGLVVRLQAFNKTTKIEWVKRLEALCTYWSVRVAHDMALYKSVRKQNLDLLNIGEDMEAVFGQFARKWEVSRSYASPELYHMCGISCCRTIHMAGTLYYKAHHRGTVKRSLVLLTHGHLLLFRHSLRSRTGRPLPYIHHSREGSLDLSNCYIYSGLITSDDLLYSANSYDGARPGHHALPRMYPEDGWSSNDEDTMTCFVIWYGNKKSWFRSDDRTDKGDKKQQLKHVSKLGAEGKRVIFKARSRVERDHWVLSIAMEIERLSQGEDVRIVEG